MMMYGGSQWEPRGLSVSMIPEPRALAGVKNENRRPPVGIRLRLKPRLPQKCSKTVQNVNEKKT